jgi:ankyrin repeat protein
MDKFTKNSNKNLLSYNWFNNLLKESQSAKEQALGLLGDKSKLQEIKQLVSRTQKPFRHYSYVSYLISKNTPINSLNQVINEVEKLFNENKIQNIKVNQSGITVIDSNNRKYNVDSFIKFQESIHAIESSYKPLVETTYNSLDEMKQKIFYKGDNITVYKADGPGDCITLGDGQSFCISRRDSRNMYYFYRNKYASTFYFVYDRNFIEDHPLSLVVVDVQSDQIQLTDKNNDTGTIDIYDTDTDSYLNYLRSKGVPLDKIINKPLTEEEIAENKKLSKKNEDLEWFKELTRKEKYKYISRYHKLTKEQFKEILNDKELINKYLSTGKALDTDDIKFLKNNSQLNIYKYAREKIIEQDKNLVVLSDNILFNKDLFNKDLNKALYYTAANNDNLETIKYLIEKGATDLSTALYNATENNNLEIVKYLVEKGATELNNALSNAAYNNNLEIVKYLVEEKGATNLNNALYYAAANNNSLEVVKYLIEKGATNLDQSLNNASTSNNLETIKFLIEKGATDLNKALNSAAYDNSLEAVKYLIEKGATELNNALSNAAYNNNLEIVKYLVEEKGATGFNSALDSALEDANYNNNLKTIKYLIERGANELDRTMEYAVYNNDLEMVKYLLEKGANNLNIALGYATETNNLEIANYLESIINKRQNIRAHSNWFIKTANKILPEDMIDNVKGLGNTPMGQNIDYMGFTVYMTPTEFLSLNPKREYSYEDIQKLLESGKKMSSPFLKCRYDENANTFKVYSHEGRGRMMALISMGKGNMAVPVQIFPTAPNKEIRARHLSEKILNSTFISDDEADSYYEFKPRRIILNNNTLALR